jgi:hypothetical protein
MAGGGGITGGGMTAAGGHPGWTPAPSSGQWRPCVACDGADHACGICGGAGVVLKPHGQPLTAAAQTQAAGVAAGAGQAEQDAEKIADEPEWACTGPAGQVILRRLRVWRTADQRTIAVVSDSDDDVGVSITNAIEGAHAELRHEYGDDVVLIEHQAHGWPGTSIEQVTFDQAGRPAWRGLGEAGLAELIGTTLTADDTAHPEAVTEVKKWRRRRAKQHQRGAIDGTTLLLATMWERVRANAPKTGVEPEQLLSELSPAHRQLVHDATRAKAERAERMRRGETVDVNCWDE